VRWSKAFIPTLRDDPADAEAVSHQLLVRAGFVRQLMAGVYSLLPLGNRVVKKITAITRDEMDKIGAQEFVMPAMHPAEIWQKSGRWETMGQEMFRLQDRRGSDLALGMTHEEIFSHVASELRSYKQLPQVWYQVQTKFRDEARPKSGMMRTREFVMKDSYSFDIDEAGLDESFQRHFEAYNRIFRRMGMDPLAVEASSGSMGGSQSVEFMQKSSAGEDWIALCSKCGYAANTEKATSNLPAVTDEPGPSAPEKFATPGVRTIDDLARFEGGAAAERQIKTLVYVVDDKTVLILLRGDHALSEVKLADSVEAQEMRAAGDKEIQAALGASPGSLGAVGVDLFVIADEALKGRSNMTTGANENDFHLRGVDVERDIDVKGWLDLREVGDGEGCPMCDEPLALEKAIEIGHIFKLGTRYEKMGARVQNEGGQNTPILMGSYGLGITRNLAAIVEANHDEAGMVWPLSVAPYEVVVTVVRPKDVRTAEVGDRIYDALVDAGIEVIIDDRDERPGVKFKDADLIGIPYRVTVGPKGVEAGTVELKRRAGEAMRELPIDRAAGEIIEAVLDER
jgi:prolyl-tRNA synthetase